MANRDNSLNKEKQQWFSIDFNSHCKLSEPFPQLADQSQHFILFYFIWNSTSHIPIISCTENKAQGQVFFFLERDKYIALLGFSNLKRAWIKKRSAFTSASCSPLYECFLLQMGSDLRKTEMKKKIIITKGYKPSGLQQAASFQSLVCRSIAVAVFCTLLTQEHSPIWHILDHKDIFISQ